MSAWRQLETALDAAARRGATLRFWWRDDDAGRKSPALSRLLELAERQNIPLAVAVVPAWLDADVHGRIAASAQVSILQHGYDHQNHAAEGAKSIELGGRKVETIRDELKRGFAILEDAFGAAFLPVLVPPWNRIDDGLFPYLRAAGYCGLSVYGKRSLPEIAPGVTLVNTHVDPVDWRGTRGFLGEACLLEQLIDLITLDEPIGILSHHLCLDDPGWLFFDQLFTILNRHPAARFFPAPYLFERSDISVRSAR